MHELNGTLILVANENSCYACVNGEVLNGTQLAVIANGFNVTWGVLNRYGCIRLSEEDMFAFAQKNGYEIKRIKSEPETQEDS